MGRRGGFLADLNRMAKAIERENARARREAEKRARAAVREAERAFKEEERAAKALAKANEADRKRMEKEAKQAHIAAMNAKAERLNLKLASQYDEIDSILAATLDVDDYVDLDSLRTKAEHPPFDRKDLEEPVPPPAPIPDPPEPELVLPPEPTGLGKLFGKKKHEKAVEVAREAHERAVESWRAELVNIAEQNETQKLQHEYSETQRVQELERARVRYEKKCAAREAKAAEHNAAIDKLIADLGYGAVDAVQEYVSIVLGNSEYPKHFRVEHEFSFDPETAELQLKVLVPSPDKLPDIKAYKYTQKSDEISSTSLSQKARKDRYAGAVQQVALRSFHEVFEADRRGIIKTISLEVRTKALDPATGREAYIPFVAAGAERDAFMEINLAGVVPSATLNNLGAAVSKNPFELVPADTKGIRRT